MSIHVLGIRHHGPGSARHVKQYLEELQPDIVLVEGPPEADGILQWVNHAELKPPVALLVYQPDNPKESAFYPFAEFSPEWQAISYARKHNLHVRFMDLPATNRFAIEPDAPARTATPEEPSAGTPADNPAETQLPHPEPAATEPAPIRVRIDPIAHLSAAAGHPDGETWWEQMFEYRRENADVFTAVREAMQELRQTFPDRSDHTERLREAHMRKTIRQAQKEMFDTIAVICGAW